jgi:histidyl-tRNA synthetase
VLTLMTRLRARGRSCETDFAGRSSKGQLTQAQRLGAELTVIAAAGQATLRRPGKPDESVSYERLEEELA